MRVDATETATTTSGSIAKRGFDLAVALTSIVLLAPLLIVIAVAIKFDSCGSIFYRQIRLGRQGKPFRIWKFRTMDVRQGSFPSEVTVAGDTRITKAGRFLRRHKLDEIPQLLNVLVGDMSLVGPRPEVPRYVAYYPADLRNIVLSVRPGLTDAAAIEFRNESELLAQSDEPERFYIEQILPRKLELYVEYVRNWKFSDDLRLLLCTIGTLYPAAGRRS